MLISKYCKKYADHIYQEKNKLLLYFIYFLQQHLHNLSLTCDTYSFLNIARNMLTAYLKKRKIIIIIFHIFNVSRFFQNIFVLSELSFCNHVQRVKVKVKSNTVMIIFLKSSSKKFYLELKYLNFALSSGSDMTI